MLERRQFREEKVQVRIAEPLGIDEVRIGDDDRLAPADRAAGGDPSVASPAIGRRCCEMAWSSSADRSPVRFHVRALERFRGVQAKSPVAEQTRVSEREGRPQRIAERPIAWPLKRGIRQEQNPPAESHPGIQLDEDVRRLGPRLRHEQEAMPLKRCHVGNADWSEAVSALQRCQQRRPAGIKREPLGKHDWQACQEE